MAVKVGLIVLVAFFLFQIINAALVRPVRDAPTVEEAGKSLDDAVDSLKASIGDLIKNIQNNDVVKDITASIQKFGTSIQEQGKDLVEKVKAKVNTAS